MRLSILLELRGMAGETIAQKDQLAVEFGRRGGNARMRNLSPEQRRDIARRAARARWAKKHGAPDPPPTQPTPPTPHDPASHRDSQYAEAGILLNSRRRKPADSVSVNFPAGGTRAAA